jgi:hypothetical protein
MTLQALAYFTIVLLTENSDVSNFILMCKAKLGRCIGGAFFSCCTTYSSCDENTNFVECFDEDVDQENNALRECVLNNRTSEYDLVLDNITKTYDSSFLFGNQKQ